MVPVEKFEVAAERVTYSHLYKPSWMVWIVVEVIETTEQEWQDCIFNAGLLIIKTVKVTTYNSMQQSPSWEGNQCTASLEIPYIVWHLKVRYHIQKRPSPVPIPSQINPVMLALPMPCISILMLSSHLCHGLPSGFLPSGIPTKTLYWKTTTNLFVQSNTAIFYLPY